MGLHPIFQDICASHGMGQPTGPRLVADAVPNVLETVTDAVIASQGAKKGIQLRATLEGWTLPANDTARQAMLLAAMELRGTPYQNGGGKNAHDAWTFVQACAERATSRDDLFPVKPATAADDAVPLEVAILHLLEWGLHQVRPDRAEPGDLLIYQAGSLGVHPAIMTGSERGYTRVAHAYQARAVTEAWVKDGVWPSPSAGPMVLVAAFSFDAPGDPLPPASIAQAA